MKFRYASKLGGMLAGVRHLLVVAPERILQDPPAGLGAALGQARTTRVRTLAAELRAGDLGDVATTLTGGEPARLSVGALPNRVSRYNCAARPESVQRVVSAARLTPDHKNAILLVVDDPLHALPVLLAVGRAFPLFSRKSGAGKVGTISVCVVDVAGNPCTIDPTTRATVDASRQAARLVDAPPTELDPQALAKEARKMLRGIAGVRCREISGPALLQNGLAGIHAVGRTAVAAPRMLIARYTPARSRRGQRKIALVGKGVTYDTGGLSIKGKTAMPTMKADMGGAAAALAAFSVLAGARIPAPLSLVLCLAENAVGPTSYKPDDILTLHSGKTVEVNNTDAEGRLLLADGVSFAVRELGADCVLDAATLTGAQLVSTGNLHAAIVSNSEELEQLVIAAGRATGDLVHPLIFCPELFKREFASPVADMRNSVKNRDNAQSSCAAQFIYWHIEDTSADWCHIDLAGPAFLADRGTGYGTALMVDVVRRLSASANDRD